MINTNKLLSVRIGAYFFVLISLFLIGIAFFQPALQFNNPAHNPIQPDFSTNSFYQYIQTIEVDSIDYRLFFFMLLYHPLLSGLVVFILFSLLFYFDITKVSWELINNGQKRLRYLNAVPMGMVGALAMIFGWWGYQLLVTPNFISYLSESPLLLLIVLLFLVNYGFAFFLLSADTLIKRVLRTGGKTVFWGLNIGLISLSCWSLLMILGMGFFYLMGNVSDPFYYPILIMGFFLFVFSYYFYKKKDYKPSFQLRLLLGGLVNLVFANGFIFVIYLLFTEKPDFVSSEGVELIDGFNLSMIGFILYLAASFVYFWVRRWEAQTD